MKDFIQYNCEIKNMDNLPAYPIPKLESVLEKLLIWVEPFISNEEMEQTKKGVADFLVSEDSKKLSEKLIELGSRKDDSWIFDYWVKSHLEIRGPLTPHTNVPIIYENKKLLNYEISERIAILMHYAAKIYMNFKKNGARAYTLKNKVYSSDEFHGVLASMNEIKPKIDTYYINDSISKNIVFLHMNRFFNIQVIENGEVVPIEKINNSIKEILSKDLSPAIPNINYVTLGLDRDVSGVLLEEILETSGNRSAYNKVKDSILVFNYDDLELNGVYEELEGASYNKYCVNRWHGKGTQFNCSKNGVMSVIIDHSFADGGIELYFIEQLRKKIDDNEIIIKNIDEKACVEELSFEIDEDMKSKLNRLKVEFDGCMNSFKTKYVPLDNLTRTGLKERGVLSGDGFIHIAFQLAQYLTTNEIKNTYVSVDNRKYFRGRTESNRPVSQESINFVKEIVKENCSKETVTELMHLALNEHHRRVKECQSGDGVNRYLFVLEEIYKDYKEELEIKEKPEFFNLEALKAISSNHLSTTSIGHPDMKYLYFPPVQDGGLGIYYFVDNKSFIIITAFNEDEEMLNGFTKNLQIAVDKILECIK